MPASDHPSFEPAGPLATSWLAPALDQIDYGAVLLAPRNRVLHCNRAAFAELAGAHPLSLRGDTLQARDADDARRLRHALDAAFDRNLRTMLNMQQASQDVSVSVVPLASAADNCSSATLLLLARRAPCQGLSTRAFAQMHGLSRAEAAVLARLVGGEPPARIARAHRVTVNTVRTQISSIRSKTGVDSIGELTRRMAMLPPIVNLLGSRAVDAGA